MQHLGETSLTAGFSGPKSCQKRTGRCFQVKTKGGANKRHERIRKETRKLVLLAEIMFFGRMFEKCLGTSD